MNQIGDENVWEKRVSDPRFVSLGVSTLESLVGTEFLLYLSSLLVYLRSVNKKNWGKSKEQ